MHIIRNVHIFTSHPIKQFGVAKAHPFRFSALFRSASFFYFQFASELLCGLKDAAASRRSTPRAFPVTPCGIDSISFAFAVDAYYSECPYLHILPYKADWCGESSSIPFFRLISLCIFFLFPIRKRIVVWIKRCSSEQEIHAPRFPCHPLRNRLHILRFRR